MLARLSRPIDRRGVIILLGLSLGLGAIWFAFSQTAPVNDPNAWLMWGHEIFHGTATLLPGPTTTWKPLPVFAVAPIAFFSIPTATLFWMWLTRSALVAAAFMLFRLALPLGGLAGGVTAALIPAMSIGWWKLNGGGCEGLVAALLLGAVEAQRAGRRNWTLALLTLAGLMRPEAWALLAVYGLWRLRTEGWTALKPITIAGFVQLTSWYGFSWLLLGDPFTAQQKASEWKVDGGSFAHLVGESVGRPSQLLWIGALVLLGTALAWTRKDKASLLSLTTGYLWLATVWLIGLLGFHGIARFAFPGLVLLAVPAAVAAGWAVTLPRHRAGRVLATAALAVALAATFATRQAHLDGAAQRAKTFHKAEQGALSAVAKAGGTQRLAGCLIVTNQFFYLNLARVLDLPRTMVSATQAPHILKPLSAPVVAVSASSNWVGRTPGRLPDQGRSVKLAHAGRWTVSYVPGPTTCGDFKVVRP